MAYEIALPPEVAELIEDIARRMIGSYIQAVEQDDLSNLDSWIYLPEHWEFDRADGRKLLSILGLDDQAIDEIEQAVREELGGDGDKADDEEVE